MAKITKRIYSRYYRRNVGYVVNNGNFEYPISTDNLERCMANSWLNIENAKVIYERQHNTGIPMLRGTNGTLLSKLPKVYLLPIVNAAFGADLFCEEWAQAVLDAAMEGLQRSGKPLLSYLYRNQNRHGRKNITPTIS